MKKLLILCAILSLLSCGSRKRSLDKKEEKQEVSVKTDLEVSVKKDVEKQEDKEVKSIEIKSDVNTSFEGKVADSTKPASIEESVNDGIKKTVFNNFKDVKTSTVINRESKETATKENLSASDQSIMDLTQKEQVETKTESKSKTVKVDRENGYSWIMWLILSLAIVAYGYFSIKKKQYKPWQWFT